MNTEKKTYTFDELWNRLPEVHRLAMRNSMQDPIWHPEGNCEIHTRMVFEYAKKNFPGNNDLLVCAIFHDLAKPETQTIKARDKSFKGDVLSLPWEKQKISNLYHDVRAKNYIEKYFDLYSDLTTNKAKILEIVDNHLRAHIYLSGEMKKPFKRNKIESLKYFKELLQFEECDSNGKSVNDGVYKNVKPESEFLIRLEEFGFFKEKYIFIKDEQKKISFKYQVMKYLKEFCDGEFNKNIYSIINETEFKDFVSKLRKDYNLDNQYDMLIINLIYKYCQRIMEEKIK